jgi:hypothetical protein
MRYVVTSARTGAIWGIVDALMPDEACTETDRLSGGRSEWEGWYKEVPAGDKSACYYVHAAPAGYDPAIERWTSEEVLAEVDAMPLVGWYAWVDYEEEGDE